MTARGRDIEGPRRSRGRSVVTEVFPSRFYAPTPRQMRRPPVFAAVPPANRGYQPRGRRDQIARRRRAGPSAHPCGERAGAISIRAGPGGIRRETAAASE